VPARESVPAGKIGLQHRPGASPHLDKTARIGAQAPQRVSEQLSGAGLDNKPATVSPHQASDFPVPRGDREDGQPNQSIRFLDRERLLGFSSVGAAKPGSDWNMVYSGLL
jgi:hypothetical protein